MRTKHSSNVLQFFGVAAAATLGIMALSIGAAGASNMRLDNGAPVSDNQNSQTAGADGPVLLQDTQLIQKLQRFDRERIPERVVHARGAGAFGEFVATTDLSEMTRAELFRAGAVTPVAVRFSTVIFGNGSPETVRDPRGFAVKFYTSQGNWDLVGNHIPVFFIRDAIKFPDVIHSLKPSPISNQRDYNRVFDFFSHQPEATHMLTRVYSDNGIPQDYRHMDGHGVHAFKFVNAQGKYTYVKFHWKSLQGEKNFTAQQAAEVQGRDFSHATRDLFDAIAAKKYPKWDLYIQTLKPEELNQFAFHALDSTKVWTGVPERKVGTLTLNRNPANVFQDVEQSAMAPSNLIPGVEASEDRMLQGRLFSYVDTQFHRLGPNHMHLPINRARMEVVNSHQDGAGNQGATTRDVNYEPSAIAPNPPAAQYKYDNVKISGMAQRAPVDKTLNFQQAGEFYRSLSPQERANLVANLAGDLKTVSNPATVVTMLAYFTRADAEYGRLLTRAVGADAGAVATRAAGLTE